MLPEARGGNVLGAMLPGSRRRLGLRMTPPWAFVMSAGKLRLWVQPVLGTGEVGPEAFEKTTEVLDLRPRANLDSVAAAVRSTLRSRRPYEWGQIAVIFLLADKYEPSHELALLLEAVLSASDAVVVAGMLDAQAPEATVVFVPLNYKIERRIHLGFVGEPRDFGRHGSVAFSLGPFGLRKLGSGGSEGPAAEISRGQGESLDLRQAYNLALQTVGEGTPSLELKVAPAVQAGMLLEVIDALSCRVLDKATLSELAFDSATCKVNQGGSRVMLFDMALITVAPIP